MIALLPQFLLTLKMVQRAIGGILKGQGFSPVVRSRGSPYGKFWAGIRIGQRRYFGDGDAGCIHEHTRETLKASRFFEEMGKRQGLCK